MGKVKQLMYGDQIQTVGQLRMIMSDLDDNDLLCIETIDTETLDVEDLYPMSVDVIDNVRLTDDTIVREVRFCQRPNCPPDNRDKSDLIDAVIKQLMDDYYHGDETCWVELLSKLPFDVLKQSLPEDQWVDFEDHDERQELIDAVFQKCLSDDDPKYDNHNHAYLQTLSNEELEARLFN